MKLFASKDPPTTERVTYKMITDRGSGFYSWNGNLYQSDLVRAAIRPKAQAVGKATARHIRRDLKNNKLAVNPDAYMRFLLEEPNPIMTGQMLQEKLTVQLELNNNAFAVILRDEQGYPTDIYPMPCTSVTANADDAGKLLLKFTYGSSQYSFYYDDVIHLRKDFNSNALFGDSPSEALKSLLEIVNTTDQGIVKAVQNSNVIRWLLKFTSTLRPEDIETESKRFAKAFLDAESSETGGVAATDAKSDATQVEYKDYVPNAEQLDRTTGRLLSFFNTNEKIVQSSYTEDEWISYYEAQIEPIILQMSNEYTRKLFSRHERSFGNKIIFSGSNLTFASMQTKLQLVQMVDRGIMTPNEVREVLNYAPVEGGDEMIRRLDTRPTDE